MLYEKAGFITPHRTGTNRRMYSFKDLDDLQFIKFLTHEKRINLEGVRTVLEAIEIAQKGDMDLKILLFPTFQLKSLY